MYNPKCICNNCNLSSFLFLLLHLSPFTSFFFLEGLFPSGFLCFLSVFFLYYLMAYLIQQRMGNIGSNINAMKDNEKDAEERKEKKRKRPRKESLDREKRSQKKPYKGKRLQRLHHNKHLICNLRK